MDIEEAKEVLKNMDIDYMGSSICKECCFENDRKCFNDTNGDCQMIAINTVLNELDKKAKIINEMKWKPISKYNRKEYDWVLVKYFDGDYECVPEVAEKRSDGKWYTSEKEIPFEVKYFFDMQEILKEE